MRSVKKLFLIFVFLLIAAQADATTYWASPSGSDANACASVDGGADPGVYRTVGGLWTCMSSGDTAMLKEGNYNLKIRNPAIPSGTVGSPTTVRCENLATAPRTAPSACVLQPQAVTINGRTVEFSTSLTAKSYIVFDSINVDMTLMTGFSPYSCYIFGNNHSNITVQNFECHNQGGPTAADTAAAVFPGSNNTFQNYYIHHWNSGRVAFEKPGAHGFYNAGANNVIEQGYISDVDGTGIQMYAGAGGVHENIFRFNYVARTGSFAILCGYSGNNNKCNSNVIWDTGTLAAVNGGGIQIRSTGNEAINNTIHDVLGKGIEIVAGASNATVRNNLIITCGGGCYSDSGTSTTASNNLTTGTATDIFIDPSNGDLRLKVGSAAIAGGTRTGLPSGYTCVAAGNTCDQGAYQAPVRSTAVVENATPTIYSVNYDVPTQSVRSGVGLQTPTVGNWAVVIGGAGATENSAAITGTSRVDITLNAAVTNGQSCTDAMTLSTLPTLVDNVNIGGTNAIVRTHTATTCTNNVGGAGGATYNVVHYRQINWYSSISSPTWKRIQDAAGGVVAGGRVAVAVTIEGTGADPDTTPFEFHFNTGGGDSAITDSVATNPIGFVNDAPSFMDQVALSSLLSGLTCPHVTFVAGSIVGKQTTQPNVDLSQDSCTTILALFQTKSDATGTINIKPKLPGGTAISYGVTPSVVIKTPESRM